MGTSGIDEVLAEIEEEATQYLAERAEGTLVLGASVRGERHVRCLRSPSAELAPLPDADSVYEIGSVSKVFTTTLLAVLEGRGLLGLEDPIRKHLPKHLRLPEEIGSLTLRQLATHSAGFGSVGKQHQRFIDEETRGTEPPFGVYTHYLRYRKEHLYADLETAELEYPTGKGWLYSVLGMGTLGHIVELVAGQPYEELLKETICEPLGLADTGYTLSTGQQARMVTAFDRLGQPCPNWYHDVMLPQGGLRSTMNDLLTFTEANLKASAGGDDSELSRAMRLTRVEYFDGPAAYPGQDGEDKNDFVQGLAWRGLPRPTGRAWWHPGTTLFYLAGAGVDEHAQVGFAIISSHRLSLIDRQVLHPLQQDWFRRLC